MTTPLYGIPEEKDELMRIAWLMKRISDETNSDISGQGFYTPYMLDIVSEGLRFHIDNTRLLCSRKEMIDGNKQADTYTFHTKVKHVDKIYTFTLFVGKRLSYVSLSCGTEAANKYPSHSEMWYQSNNASVIFD